jgi:hypothetical protein
MTPINIAIPESLTTQKAELECQLAGIASEEEKLAVQRKDIQVALQSITTAVAVLSGQPLPASMGASPTARKPMSPEARQRIAEGLRKSAQSKAAAKAAQGAVDAPQASAPVSVDSPVVLSAPQEPAPAPADPEVPNTRREPRMPRKPLRIQ